MYGHRGLGAVAGPLYTCPTGERVMDPSDCPGGSPAPDVQQQIADIWDTIFSQAAPAPVAVPGGAANSITQTLNANAGKIAIGAGLFVALLVFARAGR